MPTMVARPAAEYRRKARRLRATLSDRPAELHVALRSLAANSPPQPARAVAVRTSAVAEPSTPLPGASAAERVFDAHVASRLGTMGVVTYTDRAAFLRAAERAGIPRFRANLILAMRQHATGNRTAPAAVAERRPPWVLIAFAAVLVEVVTVVVLWSRL